MATPRFSRSIRFATPGIIATALSGSACLDRPVVSAAPKTNAIHSERIRQSAVDKVDLLFMIDNSASMADKQLVLAEAIPDLLNRLVAPACVEVVEGEERYVDKEADGSCPKGAQPEFEPINDIHIGIISSSLGGNGSTACPTNGNPANDDKARLLSRGDGGSIPTYADKGFLQWDPDGKKSPKGTASEAELGNAFKEMVVGVGQTGCGYEQSLEAVYRFLIDPEPHLETTLVPEEGRSVPLAVLEGVDEALLQQRRDFLRPDSLVAIVSLSDENDCSTIAGGRHYLSLQDGYAPPRATSACKEDPNGECCGPCVGWSPPPSCTSVAEDAECAINGGRLTEVEANTNLRCFDQKRRMGVSYLYPPSRYVDAIKSHVVPNREGELVQNPLYQDLQCENGIDCKPSRDESLVFWAMIVGVPWQDIANDPTDLSKGYMTTKALLETDRFSVILGDPTASPPTLPTDPLMIEAIDPRDGMHPITGDPMVHPDVGNPPARYQNPMNGHERIIDRRNDLQYACIFDLAEPQEDQGGPFEDCERSSASQNPLCQHPEDGAFGTTQYAAKAYPGLRHLQVARELGDQAIVASICPANLKDAKAPDYGYRPAIGALIDRLKVSLRTRCLPRPLEPNVCVPREDPAYGQVPCVILEAKPLPTEGACACATQGRRAPNPQVVTEEVESAGPCVCEIEQLSGDGLIACEHEVDASKIPAGGWCYVDPLQGLGNPEIVASCAPSERRLIRFVNEGNPATDSTIFITCQEAAFNPAASEDAGGFASCSEG